MEEIKKKWSKKEVKTLIDRYKSHRLLWDSKTKNYRNKIEKRSVQNKLAQDFNTTVPELNKKIYRLRAQFFSEHRKEMKDSNSSDSNSGYVSKWEHYRALKFLCKHESDSDSESENSSLSDENEKIEDGMSEHQDEYQMFGNYVASELRSMHFEKNIIELKRLIQQHITQCTEEDDKEYYIY